MLRAVVALVSEDDVTVYAYKMQHQGRFVTRTMSEPWYDLMADNEDELHPFAAQLGLPRQGPARPAGRGAAGVGLLALHRHRRRT